MAELRIQPKKSAPSPWLLIALAVLAVAAAAYFFLRPDPRDEPAPPVPAATTIGSDTLSASSAPQPTTADSAAAPAAGTSDSPARAQLLTLSPKLLQLTDRADLRDDATIREQRDNFTSATARLADGDPAASLRPGLVAAANLLLAVQQKAYPNLETQAATLVSQANQLSGRDNTPAEQTQNKAYLDQADSLLSAMGNPVSDVL